MIRFVKRIYIFQDRYIMGGNIPIFPEFVQAQHYSQAFQTCIECTVEQLLTNRTNITAPGMLLGKIQSGKTRTFMGIIALGFDRGYDICVILTKGTKALTKQTYQRLDTEFKLFIDKDYMRVYDIMSMPQQLTPFIRKQKLVIVVKKEVRNLDRLVAFFNLYPDLVEKRMLFIDDEADIASVGFKRDKEQEDGVSMNVLATRINGIRTNFDNYSFLQVTATPYSLYLQPQGEIKLNDSVYAPVRPVFTTLVPIHENYIGGREYFELSQDPNMVFSHLYIQVPDRELEILGDRDQRYITNIFTTPNLAVFRQSIINYLVAGSIRIISNQRAGTVYKSSFIVHTSGTRDRHQWQIELTDALITVLKQKAATNDPELTAYIKAAYDNFIPSIQKSGSVAPDFSEVENKVKEALRDGMVGIVRVNSDNEISTLLDRRGQLKLDNPFNIFIGGQILDRGLTIENFLGFFYGRNPTTFQQDTVLQHSRMYGSRPINDIAVTRFYTSNRIYRALRMINQFDSALRDAFERGIRSQGDAGVVFIESDEEGTIRPCAPNKILITSSETITPSMRFLPVGFQTKAKTAIQPIVSQIDNLLERASGNNLSAPFLIDATTVIEIVNLIGQTFEYSDHWDNTDYKWDKGVFIAIIKRLVENIHSQELKNKIYCYVQKDRNASRKKNNGSAFTDAPDDGKTDIPIARSVANETPCLILLKENGLNSNGWRDAEFWWPVLFTPANTRTAVFSYGNS